jgi:hypothetical protein
VLKIDPKGVEEPLSFTSLDAVEHSVLVIS